MNFVHAITKLNGSPHDLSALYRQLYDIELEKYSEPATLGGWFGFSQSYSSVTPLTPSLQPTQ